MTSISGRALGVGLAGLALAILGSLAEAADPRASVRVAAATEAEFPDIAPCLAVARRANALGDNGWAASGTSAAQSLVEIAGAVAPTSEPEAQVAVQASVRRALGAPDGQAPVEVRRLPGTDIFEASHVSGTASCQTLVFARLGSGGAIEPVAAPRLSGELCGPSYAHVGRAGGVPALIQLSGSEMSPAEASAARRPMMTIRVTPRTGRGWSRACQVDLFLTSEVQLAERLCDRPGDCLGFESIARDLAAAFGRSKAQDAMHPGRRSPVVYDGKPPPKSTEALVAQVRAQLRRTQRDLPLFGKTPATPSCPPSPRMSWMSRLLSSAAAGMSP